MLKNWINGATLTTVIRYVLQAIGGILVANGRLDAGAWETISGAVLVVLPLVLGVAATAKPKVVTAEAGVVPMKELSQAAKTVVEEKAATAADRRPTIAERIGGIFGFGK